ncbi:MAG: DEAD/DEAH box helicase [Vibrio sp.]
MGFTSLGLSAPILKAIEEKGYTTPSPIQEQAIPAVLTGKDIMAAAQTGTGKTAGFTLPILELLAKGPSVRSNQVRALILTPTRELAAQIQENVETYSRHLKLSNTVIFGGVKANPQMQRMRRGADILVATPGRLLDLFNQNAIKFDQLEVLVLDEADRMLDMGFIHDIRKILRVLPKKRQNLLFSATFSDSIRELAKSLVNNPVEISVAKANSTATLVEQQVYTADVKKRAPMLLKLIKEGNWHQVLVFTSTKRGANRLSEYLTENGIMAAAIHGNKSQGARTKALANFKSNDVRVLVATDIAARGIDIPQLPQVVNFDLPKVAEDYVHRIGRTGRAGEVGKAISFVTAADISELSAIERLIKKVLPRFELEGYPATNKVPETKLDTRPIKPKKPKKPRVQSGSGDAKPAAGGEARRGDATAKRRTNGSNGYKGKSGSAAKSTGGDSRGNSSAKPAGGQRRRKPQPKPSTSNS